MRTIIAEMAPQLGTFQARSIPLGGNIEGAENNRTITYFNQNKINY